MKIVIIGGGSVTWAPRLVKDILLKPALAGAQYVLYDINRQAAELTGTFLRKLAGELGVKAKITATDRRAAAFKNADYFIITIATGGPDATAHDLRIPQRFGIYHTVGDTSGPGGWARTIRNFDAFIDLADAINKLAPGAVVLNYSNPMTTLTDVLARRCDGPVVGLCHGLFSAIALIKDVYKIKGEQTITPRYAGINHHYWLTEAVVDGRDVIPNLLRRVKNKSLHDLVAAAHRDEMGYVSRRLDVATELFRSTGALPMIGDRHLCEWFGCYITDKRVMDRYGLARTTAAQRKRGMRRGAALLKKMIAGDIDDSYRQPSTETAADIVDAHYQGKTFIDVGNLPNQGQITNLPRGAVVETAMRVDSAGFTPIVYGDLPPGPLGFVEPYAQLMTAVVDACFARDKALAFQALRHDPVCASLTGAQIQTLGDALLRAHRKFIRCF